MKKTICIMLVVLMVAVMFGCAPQTSEPTETEEQAAEETDEAVEETSEAAEPTEESEATEEAAEKVEPGSIGFVMIGLGNDFFVALADAFEARFTELGWDVDVTDGQFDPQAQISAVENYIALEKDIIIVWAVAADPLNTVTKQAMDAGIKLVSFVNPLAEYDASMLSDDVRLATASNNLVTKWVNETFPDAEDGSIPCAVMTADATESNVMQSEILEQISEVCPKLNVVKTYPITEETTEAGITVAENLYTTNPEIQVYLTLQAAVGLGINNYFTSLSTPVTDYSEMGVFTINGSDEIFEAIKASAAGETPMRGTVVTGGIELTVADIEEVVYGVLDGSIEKGAERYAVNLYINADTVDEYLETGNVTSLVAEDFE